MAVIRSGSCELLRIRPIGLLPQWILLASERRNTRRGHTSRRASKIERKCPNNLYDYGGSDGCFQLILLMTSHSRITMPNGKRVGFKERSAGARVPRPYMIACRAYGCLSIDSLGSTTTPYWPCGAAGKTATVDPLGRVHFQLRGAGQTVATVDPLRGMRRPRFTMQLGHRIAKLDAASSYSTCGLYDGGLAARLSSRMDSAT